jgi:hypothetical protein
MIDAIIIYTINDKRIVDYSGVKDYLFSNTHNDGNEQCFVVLIKVHSDKRR